jgi:uncharacterized protein (DUF488 family)
MTLPFFTIGHSTRTIPEFVHLLQAAGVQTVADIRTVPRSRTNPHYNRDLLSGNLAPYQIGYEYIAELGGLRGKAHDLPESVNGFWTNRSFHNYADYAMSEDFRAGLHALLKLGRQRRTAMMCSEAVWWRCHRRIVADYLLGDGETVFHLMGADKIEPAKMTPGARIFAPRTLVYPAQPLQE